MFYYNFYIPDFNKNNIIIDIRLRGCCMLIIMYLDLPTYLWSFIECAADQV